MISRLLQIFGLDFDPAQAKGTCFLPPRPEARKKTAAPPKVSTMYDIDADKRFYGFHMDKASAREGATAWITEYDKEQLIAGGLWTKRNDKTVIAQNQKCKNLWFSGETIDNAATTIGLSYSWVEKRFGRFSTALLIEQQENK